MLIRENFIIISLLVYSYEAHPNGISCYGLLRITTYSYGYQKGYAFYSNPLTFKYSLNTSTGSTSTTCFSFSTTFVFAIQSKYATLSGHGIAFVIVPMKSFPGALPAQDLGLFNGRNNGKTNNHVFAVELDTIYNSEFGDINDNHVGIGINGLKLVKSALAGYFVGQNGEFKNLTLLSGQSMRVWVEYEAVKTQINVTLAPVDMVKLLGIVP